ncbi:Endonuclease/exonuclease/phosphatase [Ochromonadaceae sp. CCMP2298]|nr:Endonuclease/exonuclease/phosphatase [Ochromonadaceae sp. CCMP2298]
MKVGSPALTLLASLLAVGPPRGVQSLSVVSWNVNGLRSFFKHDVDGRVLRELVERRSVDVLCLQETKLQPQHVPEMDAYLREQFDVQQIYWNCSTARKGYSGTAVVVFNAAGGQATTAAAVEVGTEGGTADGGTSQVCYGIGCADGDIEGRAITLRAPRFSLVNVYVPNSGASLARLSYRTDSWDAKLARHVSQLRRERPLLPVVLVGDMNVAHTGLDYHNPGVAATQRQAGTTPAEQASFAAKLLGLDVDVDVDIPVDVDVAGVINVCVDVGDDTELCMIDTFRQRYPSLRTYSYFSARNGDRGRSLKLGMRIDYVLVAPPLLHGAGTGTGTGAWAGAGAGAGAVAGTGFGWGEAFVREAYIEDHLSHPYSDHCPVGADLDL